MGIELLLWHWKSPPERCSPFANPNSSSVAASPTLASEEHFLVKATIIDDESFVTGVSSTSRSELIYVSYADGRLLRACGSRRQVKDPVGLDP